MFSPSFVADLNEYVSNNNPQAFGLLVRSEVIFSYLYQVDKEQELSYLLEYLRNNFSDRYFNASIQAITEFLLQQQFLEQFKHGEMQTSLNSICQSLMVAGGSENKAQEMFGISGQIEASRQPQKKQGLRFEEIPSRKKIVEKRRFFGQLKVFASWYLIWNTVHQFAWDLFLAVVICTMVPICHSGNQRLILSSRMLLAVCTSIAHINMRMSNKAKKRWKAKYG